jgi:electron transfer flavoprotein alpha subunit
MPLRVAVLAKQVPRFEELRLGADGRLDREGPETEINPYCRRAIAKGVELARATGGRCTVFTLGPPQAADVLAEAIAWGADDGVLVSDPAFAGSDSLATSRALAAAIARSGPFALIIGGLNSVDGETGQVGPQVAELLELPFVSGVRELTLEGDRVLARCERDDGFVAASLRLPAVLTAAERLCQPCKVPPAERGDASGGIRLVTAPDLGQGPWGKDGSLTEVGEVRVLAHDRRRAMLAGPLAQQAHHAAEMIKESAKRLPRAVSAGQVAQTRGEGPVVAVIAEPGRYRVARELLGAAAQLAAGLGGTTALLTTEAVPPTLAWAHGADSVVTLRPGTPAGHAAEAGEVHGASEVREASEVHRPGEVCRASEVDGVNGVDVAGAGVGAAAAGDSVAGGGVGGAVAGGAVPGGAVPGRAVPGRAVPGGAVPGGAVAGGAVPGGAAEDVAAAVASWARLAPGAGQELPWAILVPSTTWGREVAGRLSILLDAGLTGDAVGLEVSGGRLVCWKPAFGGQLVAAVTARSAVQMATVRPGVLPVPRGRAGSGTAAARSASMSERGRVLLAEHAVNDDPERLGLAAAVVCVGQGVDPSRYGELQPLLDALGAELAGTRKVTDAGWLPRSRQIGLTGRAVAPAVYLLIGASGKFNHMVGTRGAGLVVAVNSDPDAPVFAAADVGIVGDWAAVTRLLASELAAAAPHGLARKYPHAGLC